MARRDKVHYIVRKALENEGWTITHDPLPVKIGKKTVEIDLGAERIIGAEKDNEKIAVEIKSFAGTSTITEFYKALGQFLMYQRALKLQAPERTLYLSIPSSAYKELLREVFEVEGFKDLHTKLIVFKSENELSWIK